MWSDRVGNDYSAMETGGGFLNDTTNETETPQQKNVRRLQSVTPLMIRQIKELGEEEELKMFGELIQIVKLVGIVRDFEVQSTIATYTIEDHTGQIKATWWLESNNKDSVPNLPAVKEGNYVKLFGTVRKQNGEKTIMVMKMFLVDDADVVTNHLLQVIHKRLMAEKVNQSSHITLAKNNPGSALADSMSFMNEDRFGNQNKDNMGFTPLQEKVFRILETDHSANGMDRNALLKKFPPNQHRQVNEALEFLNGEGHVYSTINNDYFKATSIS